MAAEAVTLVKQMSKKTQKGKTIEYKYYVLRWLDPTTGKKRGKSIGRVGKLPLREARKKRDLFAVELQKHPERRNPDRAPSLKVFGDDFMRAKRADGRSETTIRCYEYALRLLKAFFGEDRTIDKITKIAARNFKIALANGDLARVSQSTCANRKINQTSVDTYMRHVHALFQYAIEPGEYIEINPFRKLRGKQPPSKPWRVVTLDEYWRLHKAAPRGMQILFALCRLAALRRSDALALRWSNVDFNDGVLTFTTIKTKKEARVPMCAELVGILKGIRRETLGLDDRIVPQRIGPLKGSRRKDLVSVDNMGRDFGKLLEKAGVAHYGDPLHTLRKSCINDWARRHPANVVKEWATHSSIQTTMKFYTTVSREDEKRAQGSLGTLAVQDAY